MSDDLFSVEDMDLLRLVVPDVARKVTRLRARIEAADKLAELCKLVHGSFGGGLVMTFQESDVELFAATLSAYEGAKE